MTIQRLQITVNREEYPVKVLYPPGTEERNKKRVREDAADLLERVAAGLRKGRVPDTDGGQSGFWEHGRLEEMVVQR